MEKRVVKLPMNSHEKHMKNKKCDYKTLAIMMLYSNMTPKEIQELESKEERYRYLYKNKIIQFTDEIEELSKNKINTILKNMRTLSQLDGDLVVANANEEGEIYYVINYADERGRKFVTIESNMLRFLVNTSNSIAIKIYVLLKYMCGDGERKITREYIAQQVGLSTTKGLKVVSDCTKMLCACGFIKKRKVYKYANSVNCDIYYSINTHEEWEEVIRNK